MSRHPLLRRVAQTTTTAITFGLLLATLPATGALGVAPISPVAAPVAAAAETVDDTSWRLLQADDDRSTVRLPHQDNAAQAAARENRWFRHSYVQPTGRFVRAGERLQFDTGSDDAAAYEVGIGLFGAYSFANDAEDVGVARVSVKAGRSELVAERDGMVFVRNESGRTMTVEVTGGEPVPMLIRGQTSEADFDEQLERWPDAPLVTLVADRIYSDVLRTIVDAHRDGVTLDRLAAWDLVVELTNRNAGLIDGSSGVARKSTPKIYLATPELGGGYAFASNDRIWFLHSSGAARELFSYPADDQWGLWHEIGHTYQALQYLWENMTEVTVNISALAVQEEVAGKNRLDSASNRSQLAGYRLIPIAEREFDSLGQSQLATLMFDQLRRAFGPHFYASLNQEYRVDRALGDIPTLDDQAKRQRFMVTASQVSGRDLTPFFAEWGLHADEATLVAMATQPALATEPWTLIDRSTDVMEVELPPYAVPTATVDARPITLPAGQAGAPEAFERLTGLGTTDGAGSSSISDVRVTTGLPQQDGTVTVVAVDDRRHREVFTIPADVTFGTSVRLFGEGGWTLLNLALDRTTSTFGAFALGATAHGSYLGRQYAAVTLLDAEGRIVVREVIAGEDTAKAVGLAFNRRAYEDGWHLVIEHAEPLNRIHRYADEVRQTASSQDVQRFRITDDALVPVEALPSIPFVVETPTSGESVSTPFPLFSGTGAVGETIQVEAGDGSVLGEGVVLADGTWSVIPTIPFPVGVHAGRVLQGVDGRVAQAFSIGVATLAVSVTEPSGRVPASAAQRFVGVGDGGATIRVLTEAGDLLGGTAAAADGSWELTLTDALEPGVHVVVLEQESVFGVISRIAHGFEVVVEIALEVTSPAADATVQGLRPLFSGTGEPGAAVVVRMARGTAVVETTVGEDGTWSGVSSGHFSPGPATVHVEQRTSEGTISALTRTFTVEVRTAVLLDPAPGSTVRTPRPTFSGTGEPGSAVLVKTAYGTVVASETVGDDGTWSGGTGAHLADKAYEVTVTQTSPLGGKTTSTSGFTVSAERAVVTWPAAGSTVATSWPTFSGTGVPGSRIVLKTAYGTVAVDTHVDADGTWSSRSLARLDPKTYSTTVTQTTPVGDATSDPFGFTIVAPVDVALTSPAIDGIIRDARPVFTGTGQPGALIEVRSSNGVVLASMVVGADGTWTVTWILDILPGKYVGEVVQFIDDGSAR